MFNWFGKKSSPQPRHKDVVWLNSHEKWKALPGLVQQHSAVKLYGWFNQTIEQAEAALAHLNNAPAVRHGSAFAAASAEGATVIMLEHYPLYAREAAVLEATEPAEVLVLMALNDPLLLAFGGGNMAAMMERMGLQPGETIEHALIGRSIKRAQDRLAQSVTIDKTAQSAEEWFRQYEALR